MDAVVVTNTDGQILLWNPSAERIFGYSLDDALGRTVDMIVPERLRRRHRAGMDRYRETGHGAFIDAHVPLELPALRRDGTEVMVELTLSHFDDERTGDRYVMAIIRDVTDRARLRRALEEERNALAAANESLEAFTYVVSHDLKEPVRGVNAMLDVLREDLQGTPHADVVARAQAANDRLDRLLRGLLEWSRASMTALEPRDLDASSVLTSPDCTVYYQHLAQERNARVEVAPGMPRVHATPTLVCQALGNLIVNSIRHNKVAQRPWVGVRAGDADAEWVEILVEDNGPGFPQEVVERVRRLRNRPSTVAGGFGLAIARRAAERLGGRLTVENREEGGGRARVRLPAARDEDVTRAGAR